MLELLISMSLGMIVVAAAVKLFSSGLGAMNIVQQRAEMQQDVRASQDMLVKDITLAGAGIQTGAGLPAGTPTNPQYGCDQTPKCYLGSANNAAIAYPGNYLYPIQPGYQKGITLNGNQGATDIITVAYTDASFYLNCYNVTFNNANGTSVNFTTPPAPLPGCTGLTVPAADDPQVGLAAGDLVLFTNTAGGVAIAEVSNATGAASPYTVTFNTGDPLKLNQTTATSGSLKQLAGNAAAANAVRLYVITYYLDVLPDPTGASSGTPRLMRQVSGHTPVPMAENVSNLQFTYDTYDSSGNLEVGLGDAGASQGVSPLEIRKVNIAHLTLRSAVKGDAGFQSVGYQGFDLQTSISARNLSFSNRYQY